MVQQAPSRTQIQKHYEVHGIPIAKCDEHTRLLKVCVIRALDLMKKDIFGTSDPYCKISLYKGSRSTSVICPPVQTRTVKRSLNPIWNEEIIFRVNPRENRLVFELFDENRVTRDDFLGVVTVSLSQLDIDTEGSGHRSVPKSFMLHPRSSRSRVRGNLHLYLVYLPAHYNPRISNVNQLPVPPNSTPSMAIESSDRNMPSTPTAALSNSLPSAASASVPDVACTSGAARGPSTIPVQCSTRATVSERASMSGPSNIEPALGLAPELNGVTPPLDDSTSVELVAEPLPPGWDERLDQNGRIYYVDHVNKRTQWDRPSFQLPEGWEQRTDANGRVYYVDHTNHVTTWYHPLSEGSRVQSTPSRLSLDVGGSSDTECRTSEEDGAVEEGEVIQAEQHSSRTRVHSLSPGGSRSPSLTVHDLRGSTRRNGPVRRSLTMASPSAARERRAVTTMSHATRQSVMDEAQAAQTMFLRRRQVSLEDTVAHSPSGSDVRERSGELSTLTSRRDENGENDATPTEASETATVVNGGTAATSLGASTSESRAHTSLDGAPQSSVNSDQTGKVIMLTPEPGEEELPPGWQMARTPEGRRFFINHNEQRTTWDDPRQQQSSTQETSGSLLRLDAERHTMKDLGSLPPGWEERVHTNGRIFYINHNARTTQWEDPRLERLGGPALPYSRNYKQKYDFFRSRLRAPRDPQAKFELRVTRANIFEDSFRLIYSIKKTEVLMHRLWIEFIGERGLDYGGVQREWFFLLSREMFNPYYGLFEYSAQDNYTLQINPLSSVANEDHLKYFTFIGRVVGMAVYHGKLIDGFFIRPFYKMMLEKTITLKDMEAVDSEYYHSLKYILEEDPSGLDLTFSVDEEHFGETVQVDLIPNGRNIPVTNVNKRQYIECIINWRFVSRIKPQMWAFLNGFKELVDLEALKIFDANELELLICGLQDISVSDWKAHTLYKGEYHANHPVIVNFWKAVFTFTNELRSRLLQFVTGTSRVPMHGFAELWGSSGPQKFTIECWGTVDQLPRAHTCFNRLDLPPYVTFNELRCKLIIAIENAEGFDGVD